MVTNDIPISLSKHRNICALCLRRAAKNEKNRQETAEYKAADITTKL